MCNFYAVYDSCSGVYGDPFVAINDAVAKRIFDNTLAHPSIPKFVRDDAVLYAIGYYDPYTGLVSNDRAPYVVSRGSSVVVPVDSRETSVDKEEHNIEE